MIQSLPVRATASPLAGVVVFFTAELVVHAAAPGGTVAVYWQPPEVAAVGGAARAAFVDAAKSIGARFVDAGAVEPAAPSLVSALEAAKAAYGVFAFPAPQPTPVLFNRPPPPPRGGAPHRPNL
jgi:hypothetical protein